MIECTDMLTLKINDSEVKQWKSEYMVPCSFCIRTRQPDPTQVIVSLEFGNDTVAICEVCLKGAGCAVVREYRRAEDRKKPPNPSKPTDPKRKRTIKYVS